MRRVVAGVVIGAVSAALVALGGGTAHAADGTAVQQLADAYAPIVVIRTQTTPCGAGEPYLPVSVDSVLGQPSVTLMGPGGQSLAAPTSADLAGKGDGWYLDLPGKPLNPGCDYEQWFAQTWGGKPAVLYARAATDPDHPGMLALQYWFWWVFNDWNDKHEGDWEMIQLLFPVGTVEQALTSTPESIAFAQHEGSETAPWADTKVHRQGNHIVVYPAAGSHAAYYTQAQWFGKSAAAGFGCDNTLAPGTILHPQIQVMPDQPTPGFEWLSFTGRWGEKAPSFNNGPTGPNTKTQWAHPVTWQQQGGRSPVDVGRRRSYLYLAHIDGAT